MQGEQFHQQTQNKALFFVNRVSQMPNVSWRQRNVGIFFDYGYEHDTFFSNLR